MSTTLEGVRPQLDADTCRRARQELCRLAVGSRPAVPVAALAHHARGCGGCSAWVDGLAAAVHWLEGATGPELPPDLGALAESARQALLRELAARLARDLLDDGARRAGRPLAERRRDARRLLALAGPAALREDPWRLALRLAHLPARMRPRDEAGHEALELAVTRLAARLDPLGLDVALGHIALLERTGRRVAAHEEAERLLELAG